jgi:hypothetical protein
MQRLVSIIVLLMLASCAFAQKSIEQMKGAAERASGGQQAKLYAELARELVNVADQQFTNGNNDQGQATIQEVLQYAAKARDVSVQTRGKMKDTEIILRETQRRLEDVKRSLSVDDRPPLAEVEKKIEQFRQDLLNAMFSPKKKEEKKS